MTPEDRARAIAEYANSDYRSDDYEDDVAAKVLAHLREAIAEEREACAHLVERWPDDGLLPATFAAHHEDIVAAIRARSASPLRRSDAVSKAKRKRLAYTKEEYDVERARAHELGIKTGKAIVIDALIELLELDARYEPRR